MGEAVAALWAAEEVEMAMGLRRVFGSWRFVFALGLAMMSAGRAVAFEAVPEAARWVAADAVIYLEMPDPSALIDRVTDERIREPLTAIPSVKKALASDEYGKLKAVAKVIADKLGTTPEKALRDLTGGGAVFAVEAENGQKPGAVLIVTPTDPEFLKNASTALIELARQDAASKGQPDPIKQAEYRGVTGYAVGNGAYAVLKDRLMIADRPETAKVVIDRALDGLKGSVADDAKWKARRADLKADVLTWGVARLDRLRELDPKKFGGTEKKPDAGQTLLLGGWIETLRTAPEVAATLTWTERRLAAELTLPVAKGGRGEAFKGYVPPKGTGAPVPLHPPGTVASLSLWRDLSALWEARADLLRPEDAQNLNQLDTVAGQFFGGRDFGTGVLGSLANDWRLVVVLQDVKGLNPVPDVKLPAFALVVDLKPGDDDFGQRLKVAFQSIIGLANLNTAQSKAPPLELGSETFEGVTISTARFMPAKPATPAADAKDSKAAVHTRHNFSPSTAQVGDHFILSSSVPLTRDLVKALKSPSKPADATLVAEADGAALARLVELNRTRLVMQNMLDKGHDKEQAEGEIGFLGSLLRYFGHGRLSVRDNTDATRIGLEFKLAR